MKAPFKMDEHADKITAAACSREDCGGCEIRGKQLCIHTPKDLIDFYVLFMGWTLCAPSPILWCAVSLHTAAKSSRLAKSAGPPRTLGAGIIRLLGAAPLGGRV